MYYYVLLCIIMYYYVLLCIMMYYYVLLCILGLLSGKLVRDIVHVGGLDANVMFALAENEPGILIQMVFYFKNNKLQVFLVKFLVRLGLFGPSQ